MNENFFFNLNKRKKNFYSFEIKTLYLFYGKFFFLKIIKILYLFCEIKNFLRAENFFPHFYSYWKVDYFFWTSFSTTKKIITIIIISCLMSNNVTSLPLLFLFYSLFCVQLVFQHSLSLNVHNIKLHEFGNNFKVFFTPVLRELFMKERKKL